ncbi:hypothetical protein [Massilia sp. SYSU DXS3249]
MIERAAAALPEWAGRGRRSLMQIKGAVVTCGQAPRLPVRWPAARTC